MKIPFVGASNTARSVTRNAERTVNCFLEFDQSNPPRPTALYGTPGLISRSTGLGTGGVRGALTLNDTYSYWIAGNAVWRMATNYAVTTCGTIGTSTGRVSMSANAAGEVLVVDGATGYIINGTTTTPIADVDFPDGVTTADYLDGFFIVGGDGSRRLAWNETADTGTAWDGTDFASAESTPGNVLGAFVDHRDVFVFKRSIAEVWQNTGSSSQLFARSGNTIMEQGTVSFPTVQAMNNTIYWLGAGENGQGIVFSAQGYNPQRISTHSLETAIAGYTISDSFAFCFEIEGHSFYVLTFPTADATWIYDASTQLWTEWLWRDDLNELHRHRANVCIFFNGEHLVGDWETGTVYGLSMTTYDDAGDPIMRLRTTQTMREAGTRLYFNEIEIDMETGVGLATGQGSDPQVMLRYSDDNGRTWSDILTSSIGAVGEYDVQVKFGPTGSTEEGKGRVWELSMTDPVKFAVFGADAEVEKGT